MLDLQELTEFSIKGENKEKKQIIICDTKRNYRDFINSLRYRYNKKNPYIPNYVIKKDGTITKLMDPIFYSKFMNNEGIDKNAITICLENLGCLKKNPINDNYSNWIGDIYKESVYQKKWRECFFWEPYDVIQIKSLSDLILELCEMYGIENKCVGTNVKIEGIENFNGVITRSNFDTNYRDVSPAFDFKLLKKLIGDDK